MPIPPRGRCIPSVQCLFPILLPLISGAGIQLLPGTGLTAGPIAMQRTEAPRSPVRAVAESVPETGKEAG